MANTTMNHLDEVWARMSSSDRVVLLGHDRDELNAADRIRLAKAAAALRKVRRRR